MLKKYSELNKVDDVKQFAESDIVAEILFNSPAQCGVFDGSCLMFAQALQQVLGGEIVNISRKQDNVPEHYGLKLKSRIYDGNGAHASDMKWIHSFAKQEHLNPDKLQVSPGIKQSEIPSYPETVEQLVSAFKNFV